MLHLTLLLFFFLISRAEVGELAGDFDSLQGPNDGDGDVDGADFFRWQLGKSPDPLSGSDLADWEASYGKRVGFADLVGFDGETNTKFPSAEIELGEWYHVHVVLDVDNKTHDIYLDGEQVVNDFPNRGDAVDPSLNWFAFGWDNPSQPLVAYVDNISIGTGMGAPLAAASVGVPEPSTCMVGLIGILAILFRRDLNLSLANRL